MQKNKSLGIVVATKEYSFWNTIKENQKVRVAQLENELTLQKAVLVMATAKLLRCPKPVKQ